jgi:uncharacterized protein (DUF488 family)
MPQPNRLKLPSASAKKQSDSKSLWNEARTAGEADFFTLGYTGRPMEELAEILSKQGVMTVVDIRQNAVSMYRPELSKKNIAARLKQIGVQYVHLPELGVPRDIRAKAIEAGSRDVIWDWYDRFVVEPFLKNLHCFFNCMEHRVALMCVELDPCECHRHRLFLALEGKGLKGFDL